MVSKGKNVFATKLRHRELISFNWILHLITNINIFLVKTGMKFGQINRFLKIFACNNFHGRRKKYDFMGIKFRGRLEIHKKSRKLVPTKVPPK